MATLISFQDGNFNATNQWQTAATDTSGSTYPNTIDNGSLNSWLNTTTSYQVSDNFYTDGATLDAIALHCNRLTSTGTVTIAFCDATDQNNPLVEITVNASDLPTNPSWLLFKFGSNVSTGGNYYNISVKASSANNAQFWRHSAGGPIARICRTTTKKTAQASGTDPNILIAGEITGANSKTARVINVNGDYSATTYGKIFVGASGTLSYGTAASTTYRLNATNNGTIFGDGNITIGSLSTPVPRSSTAINAFAVDIMSGGTLTAVGESKSAGKNEYFCLVNADASVGDTSITVDRDTGWKNGDQIYIAQTSNATNGLDTELRTLNADATATSLGFNVSLSYAHTGTSNRQAEVIVRGRNVTAAATINIYGTGSLFTRWTSHGLIQCNNSTGTVDVQYSYFSTQFAIIGSSANNIVFSKNASASTTTPIKIYNATTGKNITISDNVLLQSTTSAVELNDIGITFTGNRLAGGSGIGLNIAEQQAETGTFSGNIIHNFATNGIQVAVGAVFSFSDGKIWHNNLGAGATSQAGLNLQSNNQSIVITNTDFYGNRGRNVYAAAGGRLRFVNCSFSGTTTSNLGTTTGIEIGGFLTPLILDKCTFRTASGIYTQMTNCLDFVNAGTYYGDIVLRNTATAGTLVGTITRYNGQISYLDENQVAGSHKASKRFGTTTSDATIYKTASPSERLTPSSAIARLLSATKLIALDSGTTKTVKVWVRESVAGDGTAYNGSRARLICRANGSVGVLADSVLATATSASSGAWEQLTATTPAITANGVLEVYVDCDGTTGWVNVDDWTVS